MVTTEFSTSLLTIGERVAKPAAAAMAGGQSSEHAHQRRIVVGGGFRLLVVVPFVGEVVVLVRPADGGADEQVRVAAPAVVPAVVAGLAAHEGGVSLDGHDGRAAVVRLPRVRRAVANHVARRPRVAPQDVVHLRPGEREELRRLRRRPGRALRRLPRRGEVVAVRRQQERRAGDELHVVPALVVDHAAGCAPDVVGAGPAEAGAREEVRLLLVPPQHVGVRTAAGLAPQENHGGQDLHAGVLDVPAELVDGPAGAAQRVGVVGQVVQVPPVAGRLVQPRRRPQQLVLRHHHMTRTKCLGPN
jgi:hypothetical protein